MDKQLVIVRGLPGGGKSTLAAALVEKAEKQNQTVVVCNCDEYFMVKGEYKFNGSKLGLYHGKCLEKAQKAIDEGVDVVIIDNTNVCLADFKAYVQYALNSDYIVTLMEPDTAWNKDRNVEELMKMGTHNVPKSSYDKMLSKWEDTDDVLEELAEQLCCEFDLISQSLWVKNAKRPNMAEEPKR